MACGAVHGAAATNRKTLPNPLDPSDPDASPSPVGTHEEEVSSVVSERESSDDRGLSTASRTASNFPWAATASGIASAIRNAIVRIMLAYTADRKARQAVIPGD